MRTVGKIVIQESLLVLVMCVIGIFSRSIDRSYSIGSEEFFRYRLESGEVIGRVRIWTFSW